MRAAWVLLVLDVLRYGVVQLLLTMGLKAGILDSILARLLYLESKTTICPRRINVTNIEEPY